MMKPVEAMTVLYVEDEASLREELARYLRKKVKEVIEATDGQEALDHLAHQTVDLVITDLRMPRMDGLALARALRKKDPLLPMIVLTAVSDAASILSMVDVGIDKYLVKPIDVKRLMQAMGDIAQRSFERRPPGPCIPCEEGPRISDQVTGPLARSLKRHLGKGPASIKVFLQRDQLMMQVQGSRTAYETTLLSGDAHQQEVDHLRLLFYRQVGPYLAHILTRETDYTWTYQSASVDSEMDLDQVYFGVERAEG